MPELPEVETIIRTLSEKVVGLEIKAVDITLPKTVRTPSPERFKEMIRGRTINKISRRGKYILIHLSEDMTLVIHLRMTGRLIYAGTETEREMHTHVIFYLNDGKELRFSDTRKFGLMMLAPSDETNKLPGLKDVGIEPLSPEFSRDYFKRELHRRRARLKSLLLDQSFIAGLGNIYTDEALHRARLHPLRASCNLTPREAARLYNSIREVLQEGIKNRGTTFQNYADGEGRKGNFQNMLRVYRREGLPCHNCGRPIVCINAGGRNTRICPFCQKL